MARSPRQHLAWSFLWRPDLQFLPVPPQLQGAGLMCCCWWSVKTASVGIRDRQRKHQTFSLSQLCIWRSQSRTGQSRPHPWLADGQLHKKTVYQPFKSEWVQGSYPQPSVILGSWRELLASSYLRKPCDNVLSSEVVWKQVGTVQWSPLSTEAFKFPMGV